MRSIGGCNGEVAEAVTWAREIATKWSARMYLRYEGRGLVGQHMWGLYTEADG